MVKSEVRSSDRDPRLPYLVCCFVPFLFTLPVEVLAQVVTLAPTAPALQTGCRAPASVPDPASPLNYPDRYAWELFVQVNREAPVQHTFQANGQELTTHSALWETWADDPWTFPANPDPDSPPQWPDDTHVPKTLQVPALRSHAPEQFILDTGGEEIHRNRATFDFIIDNGLWYTQGIAAFFAANERVDFPIDSVEVKGNWIRIAEKDKSMYHWNYDRQGNLYGLVAMHISSKALPNWFWSTFEWIGNRGRCDFIGCRDCFGVSPQIQMSNTEAIQGVYPGGQLTPALLALFEQGGLVGSWGEEWKHYRLKGSQTDFTDSTGIPDLLGNSVTEGGFVQTASCITCHSRAAVNAAGESAFPIFGEVMQLPLQGTNQEPFQIQYTTYNGPPNPSWYYSFSGQATRKVNLQMDFVWAIPFRAQRAASSD